MKIVKADGSVRCVRPSYAPVEQWLAQVIWDESKPGDAIVCEDADVAMSEGPAKVAMLAASFGEPVEWRGLLMSWGD